MRLKAGLLWGTEGYGGVGSEVLGCVEGVDRAGRVDLVRTRQITV